MSNRAKSVLSDSDCNPSAMRYMSMPVLQVFFVAACLLFTPVMHAQQMLPTPHFEERTATGEPVAELGEPSEGYVPVPNVDSEALKQTEHVLNELLRLLGRDSDLGHEALEIRLLDKSKIALEAVYELCSRTDC